MATGLARITISTPHRRLDVSVPDQAPVAELLPELLRHAGDGDGDGPAGWALRRTDGAALSPGRGLAAQGIVDGAVLHLAPVRVEWPPPVYDDPAEAIADGARRRGPEWSATTSRVALLALAGALLAAGAAAVAYRPVGTPPGLPGVVAGTALLAGLLVARRHRLTGVLVGGSALPYAFVAGALWAPGGRSLLAGAAALLTASLLGTVLAGPWHRRDGALEGRFVYLAGITSGLLGVPAAAAAEVGGAAGAAAVLACVLVCGVGVLPVVALRAGGLPMPPVGAAPASPEVLSRQVAAAAVARADEVLTGALVGWAVLAVVAVAVLATGAGPMGLALAAVTATALALRARSFVAVRHRVPLLVAAVVGAGWLVTTVVMAVPAGWVPVLVAAAAGAGLLAAAGASLIGTMELPWAARAAEVVGTLAVVAVLPLAAAVLDLYTRTLTLVTSI